MHQNVSSLSNREDRVRSLRKIPTRLHGTNLCTSSTRFAPSFVRQLISPECTQIVRNAPRRQFRDQRGGSGAFFGKIPMRHCCTNFCTSLAHFALCFIRQRNGPECN